MVYPNEAHTSAEQIAEYKRQLSQNLSPQQAFLFAHVEKVKRHLNAFSDDVQASVDYCKRVKEKGDPEAYKRAYRRKERLKQLYQVLVNFLECTEIIVQESDKTICKLQNEAKEAHEIICKAWENEREYFNMYAKANMCAKAYEREVTRLQARIGEDAIKNANN